MNERYVFTVEFEGKTQDELEAAYLSLWEFLEDHPKVVFFMEVRADGSRLDNRLPV